MSGAPYQNQPGYQQPGFDPNQPGFDPNAQPPGEEDLAAYSDEGSEVTRSLPWLAVALVGHAVILLIAAFVYNVVTEPAEVPQLASALDDVEQPTPPEEKKPEPLEDLQKPEEVETDTEQPIVPDQTDIRNEDPTDTPNESIASPDQAESPNPLTGPNSAFGLGGGGGGGQPGNGGGGLRYLRSGGRGIHKKPHVDNVDAGLQWLADHQNVEGFWSPSNFLNDSIRTAHGAKVTYNIEFVEEMKAMRGETRLDKGDEQFAVGLTGMALLAFLGDGHTNKDSKFAKNVQKAAKYIMRTQDAEGCFGARDDEEFVYCHAICTMAIAELYEMTSAANLKVPAKKAVDFIVKAQNPGLGWRYGVQPLENDSSVTAWMVLALKSAKLAEIEFDSKAIYAGANAWYDKVTGKDDSGYERTGYIRPGGGNARLKDAESYDMNSSMDACNLMVRLFSGTLTQSDPKAGGIANRIASDHASWGKKVLEGSTSVLRPYSIDYYYWYYASLALFQMGDNVWKKWESELIFPCLLDHQRGWHPEDKKTFGGNITRPAFKADGSENPEAGRWLLDEHGSWDPVDAWGSAGGRVYATAINTLTLEVYYRYNKLNAPGSGH
jgi:hypothetical protein